MKFLDCIDVNPKISLEKGKIVPFIEMGNVSTIYRNPVAVERKPFDSGVKFQDGDTVVARITPCLQNGKRFYCKNIGTGFGSTEYLVFRPKNESIDNLYLYYFMKTEFIKQSMINSMVGATGRQRVNNDVFKSIEVNFPNKEKQRETGKILSAYDDLIENNQKQIKLLEEAAQRLYKEWFVDFRFPGYETTPIIDGVPEGWSFQKIDKVFEITYGKTLPMNNILKTGKYPVYGANGIIGYYNQKNCDDYVVLITSRGNGSGAVLRTHDKEAFVTNNSFIVKPIKNFIKVSFIYQMLKTVDFKRICTGSAQPQLTNMSINLLDILVPCDEIIKRFCQDSQFYYNKIENLLKQNKNLIEARERLLPKLMKPKLMNRKIMI